MNCAILIAIQTAYKISKSRMICTHMQKLNRNLLDVNRFFIFFLTNELIRTNRIRAIYDNYIIKYDNKGGKIKKTKRYHTSAVNRAINVIELMIDSNRDLSLSEIFKNIGIPKSSLIRILNTLCDRRLIRRSERRGDYQLTYALKHLYNHIKVANLCSVALPHMEKLSYETLKTVELSSRDRDQVAIYEQVVGKEGVQIYSRIGSSFPYFHALAAGKIYLAEMDPTRRRRVLNIIGLPSITQYTISDLDELEVDLLAVRKRGYAVENQELRLGVRRVAAPIFDKGSRELLGSINISSTIYNFDISDFEKMGYMAIETAGLIAKDISKE